MKSWKEYHAADDSFLIGIKVDHRDNSNLESFIYRKTLDDASRLLTKLVVRRFLAKRPLDTIVDAININEIIAKSLKINFNFGE